MIVVNGNGTTEIIDGKSFGVYCGQGALLIERLKPAGKNEMDARSFINGYINKLNT